MCVPATRYSERVSRWIRVAPLVAAVLAAALPLARHVQRAKAEAAGVAFLERLAAAQQAFRDGPGHGGYATDVDTLTKGCGASSALLPAADMDRAREAGFAIVLRAAEEATALPPDCRGKATASNYYAAAQASGPDAPPQQAFALTGSSGRIYLFFDGIAPLERDMAPGGLATPLEALGTFRIP